MIRAAAAEQRPSCEHKWRVYDVYWVNPHFGHVVCELCTERKRAISLSDDQVTDYLSRMPSYEDEP